MSELEALGTPAIKKVLMNQGAREPIFGVRIGDMKPISKRIGKDYELSLSLYATGNSDAMYFAGMIADDKRMTVEDLNSWVEGAYWALHSESTVPAVACGGHFGWQLANEWIESRTEHIVCSGWCTLSGLASTRPDSELDLDAYRKLLDRVSNTISSSPNRARYSMNSFVIAVAVYVLPLRDYAIGVANSLGKVEVDMGDTSCKVPHAAAYIAKSIERNPTGKKRKTMKC